MPSSSSGIGVVKPVADNSHNHSALWWLIAINVGMFVLIRLGTTACLGCNADASLWLRCFQMPSSAGELLSRPWTPLIYMVSQMNLVDVIMNMAWLWCWGRMLSSRHLWPAYFIGGLCGAAFFIVFYNCIAISPDVQWLMGSSAAVIAVGVTAAVLLPKQQIALGTSLSVPLWLVMAVGLIMISVCGAITLGGQIAHIGGAVAAVVIALIWRKRTSTQRNTLSDEALYKMRTSGYQSLTPAERQTLINVTPSADEKP